jgi:signal transduction histidine kinase
MYLRKSILSVLALVLVAFGYLVENNILFRHTPVAYTADVAKVYQKKEKELDRILTEVQIAINRAKTEKAKEPDLMPFTGLLPKKGMAVLIYEADKLVFSSDQALPAPSVFAPDVFKRRLINLPNGWYTAKYIKVWNRTIIGLVQLRSSYPYENKYLVPGFQEDFHLSARVKVRPWVAASGLNVFSSDHQFLFSMQFPDHFQSVSREVYIPTIAYILAFIILLQLVYMSCRALAVKNKYLSVAVILVLIGFRMIMQVCHLPAVFYKLELFNPSMFAYSNVFSSLGDLGLWVIVITVSIVIIYKEIALPAMTLIRWEKWLVLVVFSVILFLLWLGVTILMRVLILNSSLSFDPSKLLFFDIYSVFSYFIITLMLLSFLFCVDKWFQLIKNTVSFGHILLVLGIGSAVVFLVLWQTGWPVIWFVLLFYWIVISLMGFIRLKKTSGFNFSAMVVISFILGVFTVVVIGNYSAEREFNRKKVLALNLSGEHDPVAEYVLRNINEEIKNDKEFARYVSAKVPDIDLIIRYMRRKFFEGYFARYGIRSATVCRASDSLFVAPDNRTTACYQFFRNMTKEKGTSLPGTDFYYIDNQNGRISYLGWLQVNDTFPGRKVSVFVELESKLVSEKIGYPELMLDARFTSRSKLKEYSYAKYYDGKLISYSGNFSYNMSDARFNTTQAVFSEMKMDGYSHLIFHSNSRTTVVISSPNVSAFDTLVSLSYIFVFYFLLMVTGVAIVNFPLLKNAFSSNFKNKIQYSMMGVLLASFLLIGGGSIFLSLRQYHVLHQKTISQKVQSIYFELAYRFEQESKLYPSGRISDILNLLSVVFSSDINIYNPDGELLSTSRPDIFSKGLVGTRINPQAYYKLIKQKEAEVIVDEQVGKLSYTSAYIPFYNVDNELIAIINLPYFTLQEEHRREISDMIIAVINIYMVLMLVTILLSVFMANKITLPLRLIQKRFSQIKLGQKYEQIDYDSNDEIGGLVNEYNRMVTELEKSVELLARSERESAWREMAKQIAHEINNPLTPMKLSVQHLQRAWNDKNERFPEYMQRISNTLIEEIDNLSAIASEFSNFAKMPETHNESFDIVHVISNVADLFSAEEANFELHLGNNAPVNVYADKEQMSRVLKNVIKNALQSVEPGKKPAVMIDLKVLDNKVEIRISDNGKGIPSEIRGKLFRPNFTTKSGGTGLGLAIARNIVLNAHGTITCESSDDSGSSFLIVLPVI